MVGVGGLLGVVLGDLGGGGTDTSHLVSLYGAVTLRGPNLNHSRGIVEHAATKILI